MGECYTSTCRAMLFAATILSLVFTSCRRDVYDESGDTEQLSRYLTIDKAKQLVDRIAPPATKSSEGADSSIMPADYTTLWNQAREESQGVLEAVGVPLVSSRELFAIDKNGRKSIVEQRIMVADGDKFYMSEAYLMTIIPDADYIYELWGVEHAGDKHNFSGVILFHSLRTGQFVRIDRYKFGTSIDHIYISTYKNANLHLLHNIIDEIMDGTGLFYNSNLTRGIEDENEIGCVICWGTYKGGYPFSDSFGNGFSGGGGSGSGWNGAENFAESSIQCPREGGGDPGSESGSESIDCVFKNNGLSDEHAHRINEALRILKNRCLSKGLVNIMASKNIPIEYLNSNNPRDRGGFGGVNSSMKISPQVFGSGSDEIQNVVLHELFHAYHYIVYLNTGGDISNDRFVLASDFMAYTFVNLHYGYNFIDPDLRLLIPPSGTNPWMKDYLKDISTMTDMYRKKISPTQIQALYDKYSENYRVYIGLPKIDNEVVNLHPLSVLLNDVLQTGDCIHLE